MADAKLLEKHKSITAYHGDVEEVKLDFIEQGIRNNKKFITLNDKLNIRQRGICSVCLKIMQIGEEDLHIHHIKPIGAGGSRSNLKNMELLHKSCHYEAHVRLR